MAEFRGKQGHWVTTESGSHVFIESDGTFEEAIDKAFGKGSSKSKKYKEYKDYDKDINELKDARKKAINNYNKTGNDEFSDEERELSKKIDDLKSERFESNRKKEQDLIDDEYVEADEDEFDRDLAAAFKKYGNDEDAILDELRANKKDYGMSNGDLQSVVESYVMRHFDDDYEEEFEEDDWSKWATETDKKVPENWKSDGWDGDTRFYSVNDQKGVRSASINPNGYTTLYTENGAVSFESLDEAKEFMNLKTKKEAEDYLWDKNGYIDENSENAYDDMFSEFEEDDLDSSTNKASYIVNNIEDLDLSKKNMSKALAVLESDRATEFENIIKDNLDLGDNAEEAVVNALENYDDNSVKYNGLEGFDEEAAREILLDAGYEPSEAKRGLISFKKEGNRNKIYYDGKYTGIDNIPHENPNEYHNKTWNWTKNETNIEDYKKKGDLKNQDGPMSYNDAKKMFKEKTGLDLTEDAYKTIIDMFGNSQKKK